MSVISSLLSIYLEISILMAIFWLALSFSNKIAEWSGWNFSYLSQLKTARIVFVLALVTPLLFRTLPTELSADIQEPVHVFQLILSEAKEAATSPSANTIQPGSTISIDPVTAAQALGLVIFLGFLVRLLVKILNLYLLIKRSYCWKRVGKVSVNVSDEIRIPFVTRLFGKSQIVIPETLFSSPEYLPVIIAHEGQHLRNGDAAWEIVMELTCLFFFWNPFIYCWRYGFSQLQELACDETIVNTGSVSREEYGNCLLYVSQQLSGKCFVPIASSNMAGRSFTFKYSKSLLERRIHMLIQHRESSTKIIQILAQRIMLGSFALFVGLFVVACSTGLSTGKDEDTRQVLIQTRIYSIQLNEEHSEGIDLLVLQNLINGEELKSSSNIIITSGSSTGDFQQELEIFGEVALIASPSMSVLNGVKASHVVGTQVPYKAEDSSMSDVEFVEVVLNMEATPTIKKTEEILLDLTISQNEAVPTVRAGGIAGISSSTTSFQVLVKADNGLLIVPQNAVATHPQLLQVIQASIIEENDIR